MRKLNCGTKHHTSVVKDIYRAAVNHLPHTSLTYARSIEDPSSSSGKLAVHATALRSSGTLLGPWRV